jgi:hypothetical protein
MGFAKSRSGSWIAGSKGGDSGLFCTQARKRISERINEGKAMKKVLFLLTLSVIFAGLSPAHAHDSEKVTILHCGCADTGDIMQYVEIQVSSRSKGHTKHEAGSIGSCSDGSENFNDFVRSGSDCQLSGSTVEGLEFCSDDKMAMQECGTAVID